MLAAAAAAATATMTATTEAAGSVTLLDQTTHDDQTRPHTVQITGACTTASTYHECGTLGCPYSCCNCCGVWWLARSGKSVCVCVWGGALSFIIEHIYRRIEKQVPFVWINHRRHFACAHSSNQFIIKFAKRVLNSTIKFANQT